jgi:hypothetical protein
MSGAFLGLGGMPEHLARRVTDRGTWGYEELIELSRGCHKLAIP